MKDNHFKLSSSFTNLFTKNESSQNPNQSDKKKQQTARSLDKGLFKLNPKSAYTLDDVPVDLLKKKSKNKLESLKEDKQKWSIFTQKADVKDTVKEKKIAPKKYHLDILSEPGKKQKEGGLQQPEQQLPYNIVRPSRLQHLSTTSAQPHISFRSPTLFQTPILPCFASQFRQNNIEQSTVSSFKVIQQKEGVWKIGKVKIKGNKAELSIGGISFEATKADVAGKAAVVSDANFYELGDWKGLWVVQPSQAMFQ